MNFIDLFSGAGGLSEGFIRAGFNPIAHVEMDRNACETLKTRTAYHFLLKNGLENKYTEYLKDQISREELHSLVDENELRSIINSEISLKTIESIFEIIDELKGSREVDVLIGGPPCQAYSIVGRSRDPKGMEDDPRNHLYRHYIKFLKKYSPKFFVFENVPGILSANNGVYLKRIQNAFNLAGYSFEKRVLLSSDFGVMQNRNRVIIIGWKKSVDFEYPNFIKKTESTNLKKILFDDLPPINPLPKGLKLADLDKPRVNYCKDINQYQIDYKIRNGLDFTTQHVTRYNNERDLSIYKIAVDLLLDEGVALDYAKLPTELITHKNLISFKNRFKVIHPKKMCHTIVAHLSNDGHHYIFPCKTQIRSLSIREAARIQSFPDDYYFEGGMGPSFKQIGNAVPPIMAESIAFEILKGFN